MRPTVLLLPFWSSLLRPASIRQPHRRRLADMETDSRKWSAILTTATPVGTCLDDLRAATLVTGRALDDIIERRRECYPRTGSVANPPQNGDTGTRHR
jgi:hypothetical protein